MSILRFRVATLLAVPVVLLGGSLLAISRPAMALQPAVAETEPSEPLTVPELPEGTPQELLTFVEGLLPPKQRPQ